MRIRRFISAAAILSTSLAVGSADAQTSYEKIEVGTVLTSAGISLSSFAKPIPFPEGEWVVVGKRIENLPLSGGREKSTPKVFLTLKNDTANSPIFAMVMAFTPNSVPINWGNTKCESSNPKTLVDDYGTTPDSMLYVCGVVNSFSNFKKMVAASPASSNQWMKTNFSGLVQYPDTISDNVLWINVNGNRFRGKSFNFTFFVKRKGDVATDSDYAKYIKDWTHATGLALSNALENKEAKFTLPEVFAAKVTQ